MDQNLDLSRGFICVPRSLMDQWFYIERPFSEGHAVLDLMLQAYFKDGRFNSKNGVVEFRRGEVITTYERVCERWGWGKTKVRNFLKKLSEQGYITVSSNRNQTTIFLNFYAKTQTWQTANDTHDEPKTERKPVSEQHTVEKNKKNKITKKESANSPKKAFGEFGNVFLTSDEYRKICDQDKQDYIERLSSYMKSKGKTYIDHFATIEKWSKEDGDKSAAPRVQAANKTHGFENHSYEDFDELQRKLLGI